MDEVLSTGTALGILYFAANLVSSFPSEQLFLMRSALLRANLFLYSFSVWTLAFVLLSFVLHGATVPLALAGTHKGIAFLRRWIVYFALVFVFIAGFMVWSAYADATSALPGRFKLAAMKNAAVTAALVAAGVSLVASAAAGFLGWGERRAGTRRRYLLAVPAICLVYLVVANLAPRVSSFGAGTGAKGDIQPRSVVLVVDGGSWNLLQRLVERGDLPAFERLMDEGAHGYLATHGLQYTPPSWTTIATGKAARKHGISGFMNLSSDWRAAPIWSIMSSAGRTVAVANWICTWPPFTVEGLCVSSVLAPRTDLSFLSREFDSYADVANEITRAWEQKHPDADTSIVAYSAEELRRVAAIDTEIVSHMDPDFVAYGYYSTDKVQHFYWKDMEPEFFNDGDWLGEPTNAANSDVIRQTWIDVDAFLSSLMDTYGDGANYFVVSDHGARRVERRSVNFDMAGLLERLDYLAIEDGEVDYEGSVCYPSRWNMQPYVYDLDINPATFDLRGQRDPVRYRDMRLQIKEVLENVRVIGSDEPIFSRVDTLDGGSSANAPDLRVVAGEILMGMPKPETVIQLRDGQTRLSDLLEFDSWSGRHRARGIILAKGPAIKRHCTAAWTVDDPYTNIVRYGYGVRGTADKVYDTLRALHLVDAATTLDITPTLLYLAGVPVAADMDGRVLEEIIDADFLDNHPMKVVPTYEKGTVLEGDLDDEDREKIQKRLKALGYL